MVGAKYNASWFPRRLCLGHVLRRSFHAVDTVIEEEATTIDRKIVSLERDVAQKISLLEKANEVLQEADMKLDEARDVSMAARRR